MRKLFYSRGELQGGRKDIQIIIRFHHSEPVFVSSQGICEICQRHVTDSSSIPAYLDGSASSKELSVNASNVEMENHSFRFRFRLPILR